METDTMREEPLSTAGSSAFTDAPRSIGRSLFPDLAAQADAYVRARGETVPRDPREAWVAERTELLRSGHVHPALSRYPDAASERALARSFQVMAIITRLIGIGTPEPEDFLAAGTSLQHPDPESAFPLVPVPTPHGLGSAIWLRVFSGNPETGLPGLALSTEAARWFAALDNTASPEVPTLGTRERLGLVTWTLRWIPSSVAAPVLGRPFRADWKTRYPTLPELLMLAAIRRHSGEEPLDSRTFTWLAGDLPAASFAARHTHDAHTDTIRISTRERTDQGPHIGTRLSQ